MIEIETTTSAKAVFTTREGGLSSGAFATFNIGPDRDDPEANLRRNRARLCRVLGVDPNRVAMARQAHGSAVREVERGGEGGFLGHLRDWPESDALVTSLPGTPLVILSADCIRVLPWRLDEARIAAAHARWKGLLGGVIQATVAAVGTPTPTGAAIGPGIGPCCYPVSTDIRQRFADAFGVGAVVNDAVDLSLAATTALINAGVPSTQIVSVNECTSCNPARYFSYRRDGTGGRQAGVIWTAN